MGIWDRLSRRLDELAEEFLPDELRDRVNGAQELIIRGQHAAAATALEDVLRQKPNHGTALYLLGVARLRSGDPRRAADAFGQAVATRAGFREALAGLGQAQLELGDAPAAIATLRDVIAQAGSDSETLADAYRGLGLAYLATGARDKAVRELRKALAEDPADAAAAAALADALLADGADPEEARAPLERAARESDAPTSALVALARLELRAGQRDAAAATLARVGEERPDAHAARAELALGKGDFRSAHEHILQALALAPKRADLHAFLADVHRAAGSAEAALAAYEAAAEHGASDAVATAAIEVALAGGLLADAGRWAAKLLAHTPDHPRALAARGLLLAAAGDPGARALLERAGDDRDARLALARLDLAAGDATRAAASARDVLRVTPTDSAARALLADAVRIELGADRPADDLEALATRLHGVMLARRELAHLAPDAAHAALAYDRPLLVTVMGEFSSGKSTFVNALLGAEVAPVGITPTTATINVLKYGREPRGRVVYRDDREREVAWADVPAVLRALDAAEASRIRLVEVLYPLEALERVNIVDTPGLNSILPEHEATARQFIGHADAVVWLFTAGQAGKASERDALERIRAEGKRVLGVVNKIDQATPEDATRLVAHLRGELGDLVEALVPVSARRALAARQAEDPAALAASHWPALEAALEERFFRQARSLKRDACVQRLATLLVAARARVDATATAAATRSQQLGAATARARADAAILGRGVVGEERRRLGERLTAVYRSAAREVLELVRPRRTPFGSHQATGPDRDYLIGLLERGLHDLVEPTRVRIAGEIRRAGDDAASSASGDDSHALRRQIDDALALLEARVFDRFRAYARGYLRGGHVDDFFGRVLPKLELSEDAVYHALVRDAPDVEAELIDPLAVHAEAALAALAARLQLLAGADDVVRHEAEAGLAAALDAYDAARRALQST